MTQINVNQKTGGKNMYKFIMIGRSKKDNGEVRRLVWIKGTIQREETNKADIKETLKKSFERVLVGSDPSFIWRDITLTHKKSKKSKKSNEIQVKDLQEWNLAWDYDDFDLEDKLFKESSEDTQEYIKRINEKLLDPEN